MTAEVIVPEDAADLMRSLLAPRVSPARCSLEYGGKATMPSAGEVTIIPTGGAGRRSIVLDDSQVTVGCRASTRSAAVTLARNVYADMFALAREANNLRAVSVLGGPSYLPDLDGTPRYTMTFTVTTKASAT